MRQQVVFVLALSWLVLLLAALPGVAAMQIPELKWEQRSDWINVKTDVTPAAKGDGIADDTAALQAALDAVTGQYGQPATRKTVYLPAGTYRITKTLSWGNGKNLYGINLIGCGCTTRLVWDGDDKEPYMFHQNGVIVTRYRGLTLDGAGKAKSGIVQDSASAFEWDIWYQDMAFLNFKEYGITWGWSDFYMDKHAQSTCGSMHNCLFVNCGVGVAIKEYNALEINITGCEFRDCGRGVSIERGSGYIKNCRFERSKEMDIYMAPSPSSIGQCISVGSRYFLYAGYYGYLNQMKVIGCTVDHWTDTQKAIEGCSGGPLSIIDCRFTNPPSKNPPIHLSNAPYVLQRVILSNNVSPGTPRLINDEYPNTKVLTVPPGKRSAALTDVNMHFLKSTARIPGKVFDVKRDFGAKGDGQADDTAAAEAVIAAARANGKDALAYFPPGTYKVTRTLQVTGSDYFVGGAGPCSQLVWSGPAEQTATIEVRDPQRIVIEHLNANSSPTHCGIRQTSSGKPATSFYDDIISYGGDLNFGGTGEDVNNHGNGLELVDLPAGVKAHVFKMSNCTLLVRNSQRAQVLVDHMICTMNVDGDGKVPPGDGFLGVQDLIQAIGTTLSVKNSQRIVVNDFYTEQVKVKASITLAGDKGDVPGAVTIWGLKNHVYAADSAAVEMQNYHGRVFYGGDSGNEGGPALFTQTGDNPLLFMLVGDSFWKYAPTSYQCKLGPNASLLMAQCAVGSGNWNQMTVMVGGYLPEETLKKIPFINDPVRRVYNLDDNTPLLKTVDENCVKQELPTVLPRGKDSLQDIAAAYDDFRRLWNFELAWLYTGKAVK